MGKYIKLFLLIFCMVTLINSVFGDLTTNNKIYYSIDDIDIIGSVVIDSSNTINGTIIGTPTTGLNGIINQAIGDITTSDYINTNIDPDNLSAWGNYWTINIWFNSTASGVSQNIIGASDEQGANDPYFISRIETTDKYHIYLRTDDGSNYDQATGTNANDGVWHMGTIIKNGTNYKGYYDGSLLFSTTLSGNLDGDEFIPVGCQNNKGSIINCIQGQVDELGIWNKSLTVSEIIQLYNFGNAFNPYFFTNTPSFISPTPANETTNNTQITINTSCSNGNVYLWFNNVNVIINQSSPSSYNTGVTVSETYNYSASCYNGSLSRFSNNVSRTWTYDIILPVISTNFINGSFFLDTLNAQFNFSDNFYLNSFNITIDNVEVASNSSLSGTNVQYNLSVNISHLSLGSHNLTVQLADSHTAKEIPEYEISNGLFNDYLKYSWDDNDKSKSVKISNHEGSIFDSFTTTKYIDRYTWDFEPFTKKQIYEFNIETDDPIRIINDNSTYLKSWITFGNKWMDFDLYGENSTVEITKINDKFVRVKISNIINPDIQKFQSIGDLNIIEINYTFNKFNATVYSQSTVFEGSITSLLLELEFDGILILNSSTNLIWNGSSKNVSRINISDDIVDYSSTFIVPPINGTNLTWIWYFNVSGYPFNISGMSDFIQMNITNCSPGNYIILNYTIYDEETLIISDGVNASIENHLTLTTPGFPDSYYNFTIKQNSPNLLICLPNSTLDNASFILDALTKYEYNDHVEEFHYIENFLLTNDNIPKSIFLYNLLSSDSTSYLVSYQDDNYIYVEGVIIDLLRQYTSLNGEFFSVEHGKTDLGGQTVLHFVNENVIYKANVWDNGVLQYTSGEFQALCQATPCQINLRQPYSDEDINSIYKNINYDISTQSQFYISKQITFDFSTNDGTSTVILMNVTKTTSLTNETICSSTKTLSAGSIICIIPPSYYNATYTTNIYKDGDFFGWRVYSMELSSEDVFGRTGVFLGGLGYLMLSFMGISSAIAVIVLGIIGLMAMIGMNLIIGGTLFGLGSTFIWIIIAGAILIWKFQQRRVQ